MMFCHNCGAQISEGAVFCHNCGTKVVQENTQTHQTEPEQPIVRGSAANPFNLKFLGSVFTLIALVVLIGSGVLGDAFDKWMDLSEKITNYDTGTTKAPAWESGDNLFPNSPGNSATSSSDSSESSFAWVEEAHIETTGEYLKTRYIVGTIKNISDITFTSASVRFALYDSAGNQIDTTLDTISNFKAGNTWKFKAIILSDDVSYFEFLHATKTYPK